GWAVRTRKGDAVRGPSGCPSLPAPSTSRITPTSSPARPPSSMDHVQGVEEEEKRNTGAGRESGERRPSPFEVVVVLRGRRRRRGRVGRLGHVDPGEELRELDGPRGGAHAAGKRGARRRGRGDDQVHVGEARDRLARVTAVARVQRENP